MELIRRLRGALVIVALVASFLLPSAVMMAGGFGMPSCSCGCGQQMDAYGCCTGDTAYSVVVDCGYDIPPYDDTKTCFYNVCTDKDGKVCRGGTDCSPNCLMNPGRKPGPKGSGSTNKLIPNTTVTTP